MNFTREINKILNKNSEGVLVLAFPPLLLIIVVAALFVMMASASFRFTKGPLNTAAFLKRLQTLQRKFVTGKEIYPEEEREEMERLQNKIKTTSDAAIISDNQELKTLLNKTCRSIQAVINQPVIENRTSWIKLNALMTDFNYQYFGKEN